MKPFVYGVAEFDDDLAVFEGLNSESGPLTLPAICGSPLSGSLLFSGEILSIADQDYLCVNHVGPANLRCMLRLAGTVFRGKIKGTSFFAELSDGDFEDGVLGISDRQLVFNGQRPRKAKELALVPGKNGDKSPLFC